MENTQSPATPAPVANPQEAIAPAQKFKGYSLEELRYQRALVMLQREFAKEKITTKMRRIANGKILSSGSATSKGSGLMRAGSLASKILTGLNYADYVMIGFSAFGTIRKVVSFFTRRKK